jgi:hypothetical protein
MGKSQKIKDSSKQFNALADQALKKEEKKPKSGSYLVGFFKQKVDQFGKKIEKGLEEATNVVAQKITDEKIINLRNSREWLDLNAYGPTVLLNDTRNHRYLCGLVNFKVKKLTALSEIVTPLSLVLTKKDLFDVLNKIYNPAGELHSNYQICQKGQNITTRVLGFFGLMKTTSQSLIDAFALKAGYDIHQFQNGQHVKRD